MQKLHSLKAFKDLTNENHLYNAKIANNDRTDNHKSGKIRYN